MTSARMKPRARSEWMAPAASTAEAPSGMVQARVSSGPGREEADEPQQRVAGADDALQAGAFQAEVLAEDLRLLLVELADLHLDARRERHHARCGRG